MTDKTIHFQFKPYLNKEPNEMVYLQDILNYSCEPALEKKIDSLPIFINGITKPTRVSALDVIRFIQSQIESVTVIPIGDSAILYQPKKKQATRPLLEFIKVIFAVVLLFVGSGLAIMYFHADVNMNQSHEMIYYLISGERVARPLLLSISYSVGIAIGIAVFFDVFPWNRKKANPGPLELELYQNQKELEDYLVHLEGKRQE